MSIVFPIIVLGIIGLVCAAVYAGHVAEKKRTEGLIKVAAELGFDFLPAGDAALLQSMNGFHLFSQGHSKRLLNLLRGRANDLEVAIFDYRYVVGHGKHRHTSNHTVIAFQFDAPPLPNFSLRPENFGHRIGAWFGYQDINFESHPAFSRTYLVRGANETAIRKLLNEKVLDYYQTRPGLSTEGGGNTLLFYRHAARLGPEAIQAFMEQGFEVLLLFHSLRAAAPTPEPDG